MTRKQLLDAVAEVIPTMRAYYNDKGDMQNGSGDYFAELLVKLLADTPLDGSPATIDFYLGQIDEFCLLLGDVETRLCAAFSEGEALE